jgi:hypothetical protein
MAYLTDCPRCKRRLFLPELLPKTLTRCPACQHVFQPEPERVQVDGRPLDPLQTGQTPRLGSGLAGQVGQGAPAAAGRLLLLVALGAVLAFVVAALWQ